MLIHDSKNGRSELAVALSIQRNRPHFMLFDTDGIEIGRIGDGELLEFGDDLITRIEAMERDYLHSKNEILQYLLTQIGDRDIDRSRIDELVDDLDSDRFETRETSTDQLVALGEPSYRYLVDYEPTSVESQSRVYLILKRLRKWRNVIESRGLDHDIAFLAANMDDHDEIQRHLSRILPDDVDISHARQWWQGSGHQFTWDQDARRFVQSN